MSLSHHLVSSSEMNNCADGPCRVKEEIFDEEYNQFEQIDIKEEPLSDMEEEEEEDYEFVRMDNYKTELAETECKQECNKNAEDPLSMDQNEECDKVTDPSTSAKNNMEQIEGEFVIEMKEDGGGINTNDPSLLDLEAAQILISILDDKVDTNNDSAQEYQEPFEADMPDSEPDFPISSLNETDNDKVVSSPSLNIENDYLEVLKAIKKNYKPKLQKKKYSRQENALLRQAGLQYIGKKLNKETNESITVTIPARQMGPPCEANFCKKAANRHCNHCPTQDRQKIFNDFWKLSWAEKKLYMRSIVAVRGPKTKSPFSKKPRTKQLQYFLLIGGHRLQVCMKMFLSTFAIEDNQLRSWLDVNRYEPKKNTKLKQKQTKSQKKSFESDKQIVESAGLRPEATI